MQPFSIKEINEALQAPSQLTESPVVVKEDMFIFLGSPRSLHEYVIQTPADSIHAYFNF